MGYTREQLQKGFDLGPWTVEPDLNMLRREDGKDVHLEPLIMDVLVYLASRDGEVASKQDIQDAVWGRPVSDDAIQRAIAQARRGLSIDGESFIQNIPRRGYRLTIPVSTTDEPAADPSSSPVEPPVHPPKVGYYLPYFFGAAAVAFILWFIWPTDKPGPDVAEQSRTELPVLAVYNLTCDEAYAEQCFFIVDPLYSRLTQMDGVLSMRRMDEPAGPSSAENCTVDGQKVDFYFSGRFQRAGESIRVFTSIHDCAAAADKISFPYSPELDEVAETREQIITDVLTVWQPEVSEQPQPVALPVAFRENYGMARYMFAKRTEKAILQAIELFERTTREAPEFGEAHVMLGYAKALLPEYSDEANNQLYEEAEFSLDRGVELDPSLEGLADSIRGFIRHKRGQWKSAGQKHQDALQAQRTYPESHQLYSRLLASVGRLPEALAEAQKARQIEPLRPVFISREAIVQFWSGNMDEAGRLFELADSMEEYDAYIHDLTFALYLIQLGEVDLAATKAISALDRYEQQSDWVTPVFAGLQNPAARAQALEIVDQIEPRLGRNVAITLRVLFDQTDEAMEIARELAVREVFEAELLFAPPFAALRAHPDFPELLNEIGLTDYWASVGCEWNGNEVVCEG